MQSIPGRWRRRMRSRYSPCDAAAQRGVGVMVNRTLVAGFAAVLAAGSMLAPVEASARGGGFGGGRGVGFHGGFNRHFVPVRPVPRHFVHGHLRPHFRSGRLHDRRDSGPDGANGLYGYGSSYPDYGSG